MTKQVANVQLMQKMNRLKVLDYVRRHVDASRTDIAQATGLSLASITNITAYLLEKGIISESGVENADRVGRKRTLLRFCADRYATVCVIIEDRIAHVLLTDLEGEILQAEQLKTGRLSMERVLEDITASIVRMQQIEGAPAVLAVGVSVSGIVLEDGQFLVSNQMKWKNFPLRQRLEEMVGLPVYVENVSFLRAVAYFSTMNTHEDINMLFVDMENGIGAVQYYNGAITRGTLGEIGHTTLQRDGEPCFCGNRGCLEAMCNPKRLLSLYSSASGEQAVGLSDIHCLHSEKNPHAMVAVEECGSYLGVGMANLVNLFNPSAIVINTGDFTLCPAVFHVAEQELRRRAYSALTQELTIEKVDLTHEEMVRGMAFHLCNQLFDLSCPHNIIE